MDFPFKISNSLPYILLPILCIFFDEALKISWINTNDILRALVDNSGHGTIAFLSWLAVAGIDKRGLAESTLCCLMACAIDVDHFIMAKSYSLKDALSLPKRPPFHSTSILVPILPLTIVFAIYYPTFWTLPFLTTVSVISHHIRDGHRRGIWFWPIGSTPAIPYWLYLVTIVLLPLLTTFFIVKINARMRVDVTSNV
ncbi:transmembrane protein 267-like [Dendronephthya gigantea]|uniref:transmembrane protein 267-like n=1 Tax=Dendronephthya gigantea TaxID=151771 RepID=UPI00106B0DE3|nr:transmembrane protein 267-like [Dendronephthya gigantea]